jgi:hypothetical protein
MTDAYTFRGSRNSAKVARIFYPVKASTQLGVRGAKGLAGILKWIKA